MTEEDAGRHGVMLVRVGGRTYPAKHVQQCRTCRSKYRTQIEQALLSGMTYQAIVSQVVEPFDDHSPIGAPGYQSIMNHVRRGHMPMPYSAQRRVIEDRAEEMGRSVEEGMASLADSTAILRTIVRTGFELINQGELRPSMNDLMKALQLQAALEGDQDEEANEEAWRTALITYMEIVQRSVSPEIFQRISREFAASPVMKEAMAAKRGTVGELEGGK